MNKHLAAAVMTASVVGAGFTGFSITSALADGDGSAETTAVQFADGEQDGRGADREARAEALADRIGISVEDLMAAREAGQTPAEIAEGNGVSRDELVSSLVEDKQARLDQAVADGDLSQEEADEKAADLEDHVSALVDGEGRDGDGPRQGPDAPGTDEEADA